MLEASRIATVSIALSGLALVALVAAALALTDISHGEPDLHLEWAVLRLVFVVIVAAQVTAMYAVIRLRRGNDP